MDSCSDRCVSVCGMDELVPEIRLSITTTFVS